MENFILFLATSIGLRFSPPKFRRYLLTTSGCSVLLATENNRIHVKTTREGDRISFYDQEINGSRYGLICVQMKALCTINEAEKIAIHYINKIRGPFGIAYNVGMQVEKKMGEVTISDYWQDKSGKDWKIKACTNGAVLAVLYVKNIGDSFVDEQDTFLNSFRFSSFS